MQRGDFLNCVNKRNIVDIIFILVIGFILDFIVRIIVSFNLLSIIKDLDQNYQGVLSLLGSFIGALVGFIGAYIVLKLEVSIKKKQDLYSLMFLLIFTRRVLKYTIIKNPNGYMEEVKCEDFKNLIYDFDWPKYIYTIRDYNDRNYILKWITDVKYGYFSEMDIDTIRALTLELTKIVEKYGFKKELKESDTKLKELLGTSYF